MEHLKKSNEALLNSKNCHREVLQITCLFRGHLFFRCVDIYEKLVS